jgi:hypothetical protein
MQLAFVLGSEFGTLVPALTRGASNLDLCSPSLRNLIIRLALFADMEATFPGHMHIYSEGLVAFEHNPYNQAIASENIILFIGGLGDGLLTIRYPRRIAHNLAGHWSVAELLLSSSYNGWGTGSLKRDVNEIHRAVKFFRALKGPDSKVVLMGHSTGCQDIMEYLVGEGAEGREKVQGVIFQGGVSDCEAHAKMAQSAQEKVTLRTKIEEAKQLIDNGHGTQIFTTPNDPSEPTFSIALPAH